jgi:hypothetical protein
MHDAHRPPVRAFGGVRMVKRGRDVSDDLHDHRDGQALDVSRLLCESRQRHAMDPLHREVERPVVLAELVDGADVRVPEAHAELRLLNEHVDQLRIRCDVWKHALDDQLTAGRARPALPGQEDLRHPPDREPAEDVVPTNAAYGIEAVDCGQCHVGRKG